jgi:hypothetical protein
VCLRRLPDDCVCVSCRTYVQDILTFGVTCRRVVCRLLVDGVSWAMYVLEQLHGESGNLVCIGLHGQLTFVVFVFCLEHFFLFIGLNSARNPCSSIYVHSLSCDLYVCVTAPLASPLLECMLVEYFLVEVHEAFFCACFGH